MKRRNFLQTASTASLPVLLNGFNLGTVAKSSLFNYINNDSDRVLVLIQMDGGNDGLNTVIPIDQYDNLANARPNLIIPQNQILNLTPEVGLHPEMTGIKSLYEDARIAIVQDVGYPNQNRSHFRSLDIWNTASDADEFLKTGWLGRYLDTEYPDYPDNYPNETCPDPFALTVGHIVSETCQGIASNFSGAVMDPFSPANLIEAGENEVGFGTCYANEINFLKEEIAKTNAYSERIVAAAENGTNLAEYPQSESLAQQLKTVALLIAGGLQTKVYIVNIGGFDTHANQVEEDDTTSGNHANLLRRLSNAIKAFQDDLGMLGIEERVLGMTFSEFGRQIRSNFGLGTDHGNAAPLMVFGACVNPSILGDNPEIPEEVEIQEGVPMQYDFRSVYGSVLMDWFEVPEAQVRELLYEDFQHIPIIQGCDLVDTKDISEAQSGLDTYHYPNPFRDWLTIGFTVKTSRVRVSIYDTIGHEVKVIADQQFLEGTHELKIETRDLTSGNYYYRIESGNQVKTKPLVKVK